jgi:hypothetical protein
LVARVPDRKESTYRCQVCNMECVSKKMAQSSVPVTKTGNYGDNATPTPTTYSDTVYTATSISFTAESGSDPAYLTDTNFGFADNHIQSNWSIAITTTSGTNDGSYTIADRGVSRGTILLSSTDSLTTENAATAGTVVIKRVIYKPNITSGCPFCGSLNSQGQR